jgi:hypothetical protein
MAKLKRKDAKGRKDSQSFPSQQNQALREALRSLRLHALVRTMTKLSAKTQKQRLIAEIAALYLAPLLHSRNLPA